MPTRRIALAGLATVIAAPAAVAAAAPTLGAEERELAARAAAWLEALTEARGDFIQTDSRGRVSRGEVFIRRPGKARFAYAPPASLLVVADGTNVTVADPRLKTFERYPLVATPLSLFLSRRIRLDGDTQVTAVRRYGEGFEVTARDSRRQAEGRIALTFSDSPLALTGWTVTDAQGRSTRVELKDFRKVSGLPASLFVIEDPRPRAPGRGKM
ncbi:MAG: outer-membrane lipoprotein carrier protein LolA [Phenylobacterium sp.]|jgi:outer membrane lipoprotein-sorting protein|uniref:LolA family protein n=1 Tax=Phenylobacterium sp. TaxID=1871053 RepID=UPI00301AEE04